MESYSCVCRDATVKSRASVAGASVASTKRALPNSTDSAPFYITNFVYQDLNRKRIIHNANEIDQQLTIIGIKRRVVIGVDLVLRRRDAGRGAVIKRHRRLSIVCVAHAFDH